MCRAGICMSQPPTIALLWPQVLLIFPLGCISSSRTYASENSSLTLTLAEAQTNSRGKASLLHQANSTFVNKYRILMYTQHWTEVCLDMHFSMTNIDSKRHYSHNLSNTKQQKKHAKASSQFKEKKFICAPIFPGVFFSSSEKSNFENRSVRWNSFSDRVC